MNISIEEVKHIAELSMLNLSDVEIDDYRKDMQEVVEFANQINEVDTDEVNAQEFISDKVNAFRKDEVRESFDRELLIENAPSSNGEAYSLPNMME